MLKDELNHIIKTGDSRTFRKFEITMGVFLLVLGGFLLMKSKSGYLYLIISGGLFLVCALVVPRALKWVYVLWMGLAALLGWFMTRVILSLIFYLVFFPVGTILRMAGKKLLQEKIDPEAESYWIKREKRAYNPVDSEKQY
ncbi:MAG: hypothetical protein JXQ65_11125 [Candidatus Marinimicrobia bacterium]|nr:hypothetical protein [Candidatus Neomarinimicrobiota bacterium]